MYVALPLVAGYLSRKWIIAHKGETWFQEKFLHYLTPVTISALLITLVLLFSFKGDTIVQNPLTILWIAIPLFVQTVAVFALAYGLAKVTGLSYENAAPTALIGASTWKSRSDSCSTKPETVPRVTLMLEPRTSVSGYPTE